jgi:hypothetical protein
MEEIIKNTESGNNNGNASSGETTSTDNQHLGARLDNKNGKLGVAVNTTGAKVEVSSKNNPDSNENNNDQDKTESFVAKNNQQKENTNIQDPLKLGKEMNMGLQARVDIYVAAAETLAMFGIKHIPEMPSDLKSVAQEMPTKPNLTIEKLIESNIEPPEKTGYVSLLPNMA